MKIHVEFNSLAEMASFSRYLNQFKPEEPKPPKQTEQEKEDSWRWKYERTTANLERALHRIRMLDPKGETANYDFMPDAPIKGTRIEELELSVRAENCLKADSIKTIEELCTKTRSELRNIPNLGKITINEITDALAQRKLRLTGEA
jgi:DNA-directed RNA polymerase alpha subunit